MSYLPYNIVMERTYLLIAVKIKSKVFDMFFRGTTKAKGTGLGLYIVKNGITKLGGKLEMESDEGDGTTFTIYLPKG